jgi:predicted nucleic acid-binding Zn ribbon protein
MKKEQTKKVIYFSDNYCVSCGKTIPEGQMVCKCCMQKEENR